MRSISTKAANFSCETPAFSRSRRNAMPNASLKFTSEEISKSVNWIGCLSIFQRSIIRRSKLIILERTMRHRIFSFLVLYLIFPSALSHASWICQADEVVGFANQDGSWAATSFEAVSKRFLIRKLRDDDTESTTTRAEESGRDHLLMPLGTNLPTAFCSLAPQASQPRIYCEGSSGITIMHLGNLRYLRTNMFGYWLGDGGDLHRLTPSLERGRCSKI